MEATHELQGLHQSRERRPRINRVVKKDNEKNLPQRDNKKKKKKTGSYMNKTKLS
jgi:hypothetical protein